MEEVALLEELQASAKRIAELEAEVGRWRDYATRLATQLQENDLVVEPMEVS